MVERCDFFEQVSGQGPDDRLLRPDLVVRLAGGKHVVVDAKVALEAFLERDRADSDEERDVALRRHARQLQAHVGSGDELDFEIRGRDRELPPSPTSSTFARIGIVCLRSTTPMTACRGRQDRFALRDELHLFYSEFLI